MLLSNIIDLISPKKIKFYEKNKNVEYITANSKLVKKNSIYIADFKKKIKNTYFNNTGGWVAAPLVKNIILEMIKILGIPSSSNTNKLKASIYKYDVMNSNATL